MDIVLKNIVARQMPLKYYGNNDACRRVLQTTITSLILRVRSSRVRGCYRDLFLKLYPLRICQKKKIDFFQKFTPGCPLDFFRRRPVLESVSPSVNSQLNKTLSTCL